MALMQNLWNFVTTKARNTEPRSIPKRLHSPHPQPTVHDASRVTTDKAKSHRGLSNTAEALTNTIPYHPYMGVSESRGVLTMSESYYFGGGGGGYVRGPLFS